MVGDSNIDSNFSHKSLLIDTQVSRIRKAFANGSSSNMKLLKTQLSQVVQLGGFLGRLLNHCLRLVCLKKCT